MHRLTLRFGVALIAFTVGVTATILWAMYYRRGSNDIEKPLTKPPLACFPGLSMEIKTMRPSPEGYFPEHTFSTDPRTSTFIDSQYSKRLAAMHESSFLNETDTNGFHLRFLWLRSFHAPIIISLQQSGDNYILRVKQRKSDGDLEPGEFAVNHERPLTSGEWATLSKLFDEACFWNIPSISTEPLSEDGAWWLLEGVSKERYHIVNRQSPESGPYRQVCLYLLKLADLDIEASAGDIY